MHRILLSKEACPVGMSEIFVNMHYSVNLTNDLGACMGGRLIICLRELIGDRDS